MRIRLRLSAGFAATVLLLGAATASPLSAQIQVAPFFAGYYPVGNLGTSGQIEAIQNQGLGGGLGLGYMFSDQMGVQLVGTYLFSDAFVRACNFDPTNFPGLCLTSENLKGWIMMGDVVLKFRPPRSNFFLLVGPSLVYRGGDAWQGYTSSEKTSFGGVVGLGVIARVAPKFALEIEADVHGYSFDPDGSTSTVFGKKFRPDLVVKVGVPIPAR
jgi:hypothetical protein